MRTDRQYLGRRVRWRRLVGTCALLMAQAGCNGKAGAEPQSQPVSVGEQPAITRHVAQADLVANKLSFDEMFTLGQELFVAKFNRLDGLGRPGATGNGVPSHRQVATAPDFLRTSSPDSVSCAACHNDPRPGGAGDFVANVFVLAQVRDPVVFDVRESDERNTLGMMGSGAIESLGREMTADLQAIRTAAMQQAQAQGAPVTVSLTTQGVDFGNLTANPDGNVDTSQVSGVDADLIVKPFSQKGVTRSLREFTVNAMNHHHGMEAVERFGRGQKDSQGNAIDTADFDGDGVPDELTVGDITALTMFQAFLNVPGQVMPGQPERVQAVLRGERRFRDVGCAACHVPELVLKSTTFCEPYVLNPPGTFSDQSQRVCADLSHDGPGPRLTRQPDGSALVRAFTDLKRHKICDVQDPHYCNEQLIQSGCPTDEFLTRKLWDVGNSGPYGHRGDLSTITEAILAHGAEGRVSRDAFKALSADAQADVVEFLKSVQVLPDGASASVVDNLGRPADKRALAAQFGIE